MEKTRKINWTKEEEYTLIDAIQAAGNQIRGTGQSAEINKKNKALWNGMMSKVNSIHGNNRDIKDIKKNGTLSKSPQRPVWTTLVWK